MRDSGQIGESSDLTLYHAWMSSASRRVRFCLEEKGLTYNSIVLDLQKKEQHAEAYCAINPNGLVPTLIHRNRTLIESTAINEYIDETFPETTLRPHDAYGRATMRVWTKYVDEVVIRAFQVASWNQIMQPVASQWTDEELEVQLARIPTPDRREDWRRMAREPFTPNEIDAAMDNIRHMLSKIERSLETNVWLAGDDFSLAEIHFAPYIVRLNEFSNKGITIPAGSALAEWWSRVASRPAFKAARIEPIRSPTSASAIDSPSAVAAEILA